MKKQYILVDIGCIECGMETNIVGIFTNKKFAERLAENLDKELDFHGGGQHSFEVFEKPTINKFNYVEDSEFYRIYQETKKEVMLEKIDD